MKSATDSQGPGLTNGEVSVPPHVPGIGDVAPLEPVLQERVQFFTTQVAQAGSADLEVFPWLADPRSNCGCVG